MKCFKRFSKAFLVVLFAFGCVGANAQNTSKAEVFIGYSYFHAGDLDDGHGMHGFNIEAVYNVDRRLGIVGDISMHFSDRRNINFRRTLYLFGPEANLSTRGRAVAFLHLLVGGANDHVSAGSFHSSTNCFAFAAGGGIDLNTRNRKLAIRLLQADYVLTTFGNGKQHNLRLSTGLVVKL